MVREGSITRNANAARNVEILEAFDDLRDWFSSEGLWDTYRDVFTRLAVDHILLAASVRVLKTDPAHPLLKEFQSYMDSHFPHYMDCPYLSELPQQHKLILKLLRGGHFKTIRALFALKDSIAK